MPPVDQGSSPPAELQEFGGGEARTPGGISPVRATLVVVAIGLVVGAAVSWTALVVDHHNEHRLLEVQTRRAAAVLVSTILSIQGPLKSALQVELATGESAGELEQFGSAYVGPGQLFVSASMFISTDGRWQIVASVGAKPLLDPSSSAFVALVTAATSSSTFVVRSVRSGNTQRIAYAIADRQRPGVVLYAERTIPANHQVAVESGSAFSDLEYATYLGRTTATSALATTDVPRGSSR